MFTGLSSDYFQQTGNHVFRTAASVSAGSNVSLTEIMRLTSGGNVGISTTSPSPDYGSDTVLEVKGSTSPGIVINDTGQASKYGIHADSNDLKITLPFI